LTFESSLHGHVTSMGAFHPIPKLSDLLAVLVEHRMFCVLRLDENGKLVSISNIDDLLDSLCHIPELVSVTLAISCRCIAFGFYNGLLKFAEMDSMGHVKTIFNSRIHSSYIIDTAFLNNFNDKLVLAVLGDDRSCKQVLT